MREERDRKNTEPDCKCIPHCIIDIANGRLVLSDRYVNCPIGRHGGNGGAVLNRFVPNRCASKCLKRSEPPFSLASSTPAILARGASCA
jgi:hypothetical protein